MACSKHDPPLAAFDNTRLDQPVADMKHGRRRVSTRLAVVERPPPPAAVLHVQPVDDDLRLRCTRHPQRAIQLQRLKLQQNLF